jgi:hypothetical protein
MSVRKLTATGGVVKWIDIANHFLLETPGAQAQLWDITQP